MSFIQKVQRASKRKIKVLSRHSKGLDEVYPKLDKQIKEIVADGFEKLESAYELFGGESEPQSIEHKSRDGFISSNDGGYQQSMFTTVGNLLGSGLVTSLPEKAEKAVNKAYETGCKFALKEFKEKYAKEIKDIPEDKLNFHDLYELEKADLAEELSDLEDEQNRDDGSTVMFQLLVMFHNKGKDNLSFTIQGVVNWEAPYHRSQDKFEDYYQTTVDFEEKDVPKIAAEVKREVKKAVKYLGA